MEVLEAIKTRRSVRHYRPEAVDEATLQELLEAARWAPSWSNTQCWRFVIVRDAGLKSRLAASLEKTVKSSDGSTFNPAARALTQAPVIIVFCAQLGRAGFEGGAAVTDKGDWYMFDVALAVQNLALAAHALGLGTVIVGAFNAREVAAALGVPPGYAVVAMTPLGFPERPGKAPARKELAELVSRDRFPA